METRESVRLQGWEPQAELAANRPCRMGSLSLGKQSKPGLPGPLLQSTLETG